MSTIRLINGNVFLTQGGVQLVDATPVSVPTSSDFTTSVLHNFSVINTESGVSSAGYFQGGLGFAKDVVPDTATVVVKTSGQTVSVQSFTQINRSVSGNSARWGVLRFRDRDLAPGEERAYTVHVTAAGATSTSPITLADVAAFSDFGLSVSNWTTGGVGNSDTTIRFNSAATVADNVRVIAEGAYGKTWRVLHELTSAMNVVFYLDAIDDGTGSIEAVRAWAVFRNSWWQEDKDFEQFDCEVLNSTATLETYTSIDLYGNQNRRIVRLDDDAQHCEPFWIGAPKGVTNFYKFDRDAFIESKHFPPFRFDITPDASATYHDLNNPTYDGTHPSGTSFLTHRYNIGQAGGYQGRGWFPETDNLVIYEQTASAMRNSRTASMAGFVIPYHYRDKREVSAGVVADTVMSNIIGNSSDGFIESYSNMASALEFSLNPNIGGPNNGYGSVTGGDGPWTTESFSPHAVNYNGFQAMITGDPDQVEQVLELASRTILTANANSGGQQPTYLFQTNTVYTSVLSIPNTTHKGIPILTLVDNDRTVGWTALLWGMAAGLVSDSDPDKEFIIEANKKNADFLANSLTYFDQNMLDAGVFGTRQEMISPWMHNFQAMGSYAAYQLTDYDNWKAWGEHISKDTVNKAKAGLWHQMAANRACMLQNTGTSGGDNASEYDPGAPSLKPFFTDGSKATGGATINWETNSVSLNDLANGKQWTVGDRFKFLRFQNNQFNDNTNPNNVPQEVEASLRPFVYLVSQRPTGDWMISLTEGGSELTLTPQDGVTTAESTEIAIMASSYGDAYDSIQGSDTFLAISFGTVILAYHNNHPNVSIGIANEVKAQASVAVAYDDTLWWAWEPKT